MSSGGFLYKKHYCVVFSGPFYIDIPASLFSALLVLKFGFFFFFFFLAHCNFNAGYARTRTQEREMEF
jgi:hypothetical protein